ncbi:putative transcriptional regulator [Achromobacter sp. JUb104]|nr:putative transcriptional regulator [Achromobacter sp. JUb104]
MNGIEFILRDRAGWVPKLPIPRSRFRWVDSKPKPLTRLEVAFIRSVKGALNSTELAHCYQVTPQTIRNIWEGRRHPLQPSGKRPGRRPKSLKVPA